MSTPLVVGFGGTARPDSSGERLVSAVLAEVQSLGARTRFFGGSALAALPHFSPESEQRTPEQLEFVEAIRAADGVVIATPGYHGGVSGLVKNAIDLLEDLREDGRAYFEGRAVGLIVTCAGWQACGGTLMSLRGIVHAMRGWPTPLGIAVNTATKPFAADGSITDPGLIKSLKMQARQVLQFSGMKVSAHVDSVTP
jgi:FMN reductase